MEEEGGREEGGRRDHVRVYDFSSLSVSRFYTFFSSGDCRMSVMPKP